LCFDWEDKDLIKSFNYRERIFSWEFIGER